MWYIIWIFINNVIVLILLKRIYFYLYFYFYYNYYDDVLTAFFVLVS